MEFLRFMAQQSELDALASIKGVPSITKETTDERYANLRSLDKVESTVIADGTVPIYFGVLLNSASGALLKGETADADAAVQDFVSHCAESVQG